MRIKMLQGGKVDRDGTIFDSVQAMVDFDETEKKRELQEARAGIRQSGTIAFKVSQAGAVSVYGLQRNPVTLYAGQWEALIKQVPALEAFLRENTPHLATKDGPPAKPLPNFLTPEQRKTAAIEYARSK